MMTNLLVHGVYASPRPAGILLFDVVVAPSPVVELPQGMDRRLNRIIMKFISATEFKGESAWDALPVANMNGTTTRLHWTDRPYKWHVNDGEEVFVVLDGAVDMYYRENGVETRRRMNVGDIFYASSGTEHVAHPVGEARVLVVESEGSV